MEVKSSCLVGRATVQAVGMCECASYHQKIFYDHTFLLSYSRKHLRVQARATILLITLNPLYYKKKKSSKRENIFKRVI